MTKVEKKRVSILGCGWLGFPLAQRIRQRNISDQVKGSTTSASKVPLFQDAGIEPFVFDMSPAFSVGADQVRSFMDADVLVIAIPPKLAQTGQDFHVRQINQVIHAILDSPVREVIYISSTSIYPDANKVMIESDVVLPEESPAPSIVKAENALIALRPQLTVSILRLGGLLGYTRNPGKYVRGQKDMITGSIPVNYIHRNDAAEVVASVIESGIVNETFNVVAPLHPTRSEVYLKSCRQFGWEAPTFQVGGSIPDFKIISPDKFLARYNYEYQFADPLDFYYESD
jgi:nucleoside-diphosphate-sugar epimerase